MNNNTSCFFSSLKYSAIVSPVSATLIRAPGGSFICPNTKAVLARTPDSPISVQRSLPSLERSPTPVKIEYPPCSVAILLINSWISTVLPTPAPPNRPILPPFAYGAKRSITLIPVSRISTAGFCSSNVGGSLWITIFGASLIGSPSSIVSPSTLKRRPNVFSPTGTLIPLPSAVTSISLWRPSLAASIIHLTTWLPICCATSITHFLSPFCTSRASLIAGNSWFSNSTSTTGPRTWIIFPVFIKKASLYYFRFLFLLFLLRLRSGYYLRNLLRDRSLSGSVIFNIQFF